MAHFRATIKGQRGAASRLGGKASGISATVNGWNVGVRIDAACIDERDRITIHATGGSNNSSGRLIGVINERGEFAPAVSK